MGWFGGANLASEMWAIVRPHIDPLSRQEVAKAFIETSTKEVMMNVPIEMAVLLAEMVNVLAHNTPIKPTSMYAHRIRDMLVKSGCIKFNTHYYEAVQGGLEECTQLEEDSMTDFGDDDDWDDDDWYWDDDDDWDDDDWDDDDWDDDDYDDWEDE